MYLFQTRIKDVNKLDDAHYNIFVQRLIEYFKPSSKMYGEVELRPEVLPLNLFTLALFDLIDDLMDAPNVRIIFCTNIFKIFNSRKKLSNKV